MNDDQNRGPDEAIGGGLSERALQPAADRTRAENAGGQGGTDSLVEDADPAVPRPVPDEVLIARPEDQEIVAEAAALGSGPRPNGAASGQTSGDALHSGAGRDVGSGTPGDKGELGGGAPLGQQGGVGPESAASPGGDSRD